MPAMKVVCNIENIKQLNSRKLSSNEKDFLESYNLSFNKLNLTYKKEYTVLGIDYKEIDYVYFMLVDDTEVYYPNFYPIEFFDIIDYRLSRYWYNKSADYYPMTDISYPSLISFRETSEKYFFDDLLNNENNIQSIFLNYQYLMDHEYPDLKLKTAILIENCWCFCAYCNETWEVTKDEGIISCSYCHNLNNNPLWLGIPPFPPK